MTKNVQQEIIDSNPGRINIKVDVQVGPAKKKVELPLRLIAIGEFTGAPMTRTNKDGKEEVIPLKERTPINVNKDNFDRVLASLKVQADYVVDHPPRDGKTETKVSLKFGKLGDFHPEAVAQQVPHILRLVAARNLLEDLRNRVINATEFRKGLEAIVRDPAARKQLAAELDRVMSNPPNALPDVVPSI